jgi:tetratricopeptide (TPR) repeat protein
VIERNPKSDSAYNLRASIRYQMGDFASALADHLKAFEIDPDDAATLNHIAWVRAVCPRDDLRDGSAALRDALRACELTNHEAPGYVDTLAAAYAELGRFEDAVKWQQKAVELAPEAAKAEYETRLALYRENKPFRDEVELPAAELEVKESETNEQQPQSGTEPESDATSEPGV